MNDKLSDHQLHILDTHFDPRWGSAYWLEKARGWTFDCRRDVRSLGDLQLFGPMDSNDFRRRPMEDFIPRRLLRDRAKWVRGETGGATGAPTPTVYLDHEFDAAFVQPFLRAAAQRRFPRELNWLWIGPGGPHLIGKAARECAKQLGSADPFAVDFDPRWIRRFTANSIGFLRYLDHVISQTMDVIHTQFIEVLFSTPPVFNRLRLEMSEAERLRIRGIHFGGLPVDAAVFNELEAAFPRATFIAGYGNSLAGMCPEFQGRSGAPLDYFPLGTRLVFGVAPEDPCQTPEEKIRRTVFEQGAGQIVFSRFDESLLILNLAERDHGELVMPDAHLQALGFTAPGVRNPRPAAVQQKEVSVGLY